MMGKIRFSKLNIGEPVFSLASSKTYLPSMAVSKSSTFGDSYWNMSEYVELAGLGNKSDGWDFSSLPGFPSGFALAGAELAISMLKNPVDSQSFSAWLTVRQHLSALNDFSEFAASMGCYRFSEVSQPMLSQYLNVLMFGNEEREAKSPARTKTLISFIYKVWEYSPRLTEPMKELPFNRNKEKIMDSIPGEDKSRSNKTPPIPEFIFGPLMSVCMDYVLDYSSTLLPAWRELQFEWETNIATATIGPSGKEKRLRKASAKILAKYPTPWLKSTLVKRGTLYKELYRLRTACILVILAYSGVRASELFSIEEKCCVVEETEDGQVIHYLNTMLRKHRYKGSKDTWVIVEEVVKAIQVLEEMTKHARDALGTKRLLVSGTANQFFNVMHTRDSEAFVEYNTGALLWAFAEFQRHVGEELNRPQIPLWTNSEGVHEPWRFNTLQFRRTLARHIAREPFGIIAGMRQFKHVSVAVFEGYGSIDTEWLDMVGEEQGLADFEFIDELAISLSTGSIAGEAGRQIKDSFEKEFKGRAEDFPPSTIAKWLASTHKTLFVGKFNFCFFEPTKARCLRKSDNKERPILNSCEPDSCENACVTKKHLPLWTAQLKQVEDAIRHPKTAALAKLVMSEEASKIRKIITAVKR